MVGFAYRRAAAGERMPGLIATTNEQAIGSAIDDLLLIAEYMLEEEIRAEHGTLPLPQDPGIGVRFDMKAVDRFAVDRWE